jgi:hypothetical protein
MEKDTSAEEPFTAENDGSEQCRNEQHQGSEEVKKISWEQARDLTFTMIRKEWGDQIHENKTFKDSPQKGLNKKNNQVMALASPINRDYFRDYCAQVTVSDLDGLKDVYELVDVILQHISDIHRA